jgi:HEAT repeat protein
MLCAAIGCSKESAQAPLPAVVSTLPTRAVVKQALAELVFPDEPVPPAPQDADERVDGLLETLASADHALRAVAQEELGQLGASVVPHLAARMQDRARAQDQRVAASAALGQIGAGGCVAAAEALLAQLESSRTVLASEREPWLYAQCAWQLGKVAQWWVVPRLLLCLKYETDRETVIWLAESLASYGLLSGLDALFVIVGEGPDAPRELAQGVLQQLAERNGSRDWNELARAWSEGEPWKGGSVPPIDARYEREVWRMIASLAGWQLRDVDDARYVLSRLRAEDAEKLAAALADENLYVRQHAAQCLERMGPRGRAGGAALIERLDDPQVGPQAAAALGALRFAPAADALRERIQPGHALDLRVAAARALGRIAPPDLEAALRPLYAPDQVADLRCAAAAGLVMAAPADTPPSALGAELRQLAAWLGSVEVEPSVAEEALGAWLARRAAAGDASAASALEAWIAVPAAPVSERLAARAALFEQRASALGL